MRNRRRSVSWERSRGRRTALFLAGLVLCSVVAFLWLRSTDVFAVQRITATGAEQVTEEQLASITSLAIGKSLLSFSSEEVEEAFLTLPYVESVQVVRSFPNTLEIKLVEYRPVARLRASDGQTWLVSDGGTVIEGDATEMPSELPLVVPVAPVHVTAGDQLPASIAAVLPLAECLRSDPVADALPDIDNIAVSAAGCATVVFEDGGELRLGTPDGLRQKLQIAADIVQRCAVQGRVIEYIDASVVDRVAVKGK